MSEDEARTLAEERARARADHDFTRADALRDRLRELGWEVLDAPGGYELRPAEPRAEEGLELLDRSDQVPSLLDEEARCQVTVHWLVEGWPEDVARGVRSFLATTSPSVSQEHVVVDATGGAIEDRSPEAMPDVRMRAGVGWGAGRNAGLRRSLGRVVVVADGSVEASGDVLTPLLTALEDPTVGVAGPFGIVSDDLREFREAPGPDVDAIEGYLLAFRRDLLARGVRFDERFRFYRSADIELSFQVKALGLRAVALDLPVIRHEHRMWTTTPPRERERLSKRNFYRFLDRWRGRTDLLVAARPRP
jgi:hypothetical protein